jgi:glucokinase
MKNIGIGVDIGGSHIVCCAIDMSSGQPIEGTEVEEKVDNKGTKEEIFETWAKALNGTIKTIDTDSLIGIGFAMPGAFNYKTGVASFEGTEKYGQLYDVNVKEELPKYLDVENAELRFINDASAFAVGEAWFGKAKESKGSISITLGTGFGSAFVENDIPVVERDDVPSSGCFWHLPYKDGIADDYFSTRWFVNSYEEMTGQKASGVKDVAVAAAEGGQAQELFDEFGRQMGDFLIPWLKKFKPEALVIGGNVSKAFDLFYPSFHKQLQANSIELNVFVSELMEEAALIGSARLLDENFWAKVKDDLPEK